VTPVMSRVVEVLDAASAAAWDCRGTARAIDAAQTVLRSASPAEGVAAFAAWRRALDYKGANLVAHLTERYRNAGDIGLSLTRAALMVEQGEQP
jgi:hypothetical protein